MGYQGPEKRRDTSNNIPFTPGVGDKWEMWDKMLKEMEKGRFAGPYSDIPFENFVQSPVGLVPKAGNKTRLIFHLSYDFQNGKSINHWTPKEICTVNYNDLDQAVRLILKLMKQRNYQGPIFFAKSDLMSAFRILPILPKQRNYLIMKAENPNVTPRTFFYFIEKNLSFGGSISCSHFQHFSEGLRHIFERRTGKAGQIINYLDDFLFFGTSVEECDFMVRNFLSTCQEIGFPVSLDKTEWGTDRIVFLGILLEGNFHRLAIPLDKQIKATHMLQRLSMKTKATVADLESLSGYLNFLNKAIVPGRVFTRRMYAKFTGKALLTKQGTKLKQHHHVKIDREFRRDCSMWLQFLSDQGSVNRPFIDLNKNVVSTKINFYSDASAGENLGFGAWFNTRWLFGQWEKGFIKKNKPSIAFLEMYALCMGIFTWAEKLKEVRITVFCDNKSVVDIINGDSSGCPYCMELLRMLTINNMQYDRRVFSEHVEGRKNTFADLLSRQRLRRFKQLAPDCMEANPERLPGQLWPLSVLWEKFKWNLEE